MTVWALLESILLGGSTSLRRNFTGTQQWRRVWMRTRCMLLSRSHDAFRFGQQTKKHENHLLACAEEAEGEIQAQGDTLGRPQDDVTQVQHCIGKMGT